jgi:hypothetical protein
VTLRLPIPSLTKSEMSFGQAICNVGLRQTSLGSFVAVDGNWVEKSEKEGMALKAEKFTLDVYSAFSYTQQAFGALKSEQPGKHQLIGEERTKFNKYVLNCLGDLKREATRIYKEKNGIVATRASVAFFDWLLTGDKSVMANIRQRAINAKAKKEISDSDIRDDRQGHRGLQG